MLYLTGFFAVFTVLLTPPGFLLSSAVGEGLEPLELARHSTASEAVPETYMDRSLVEEISENVGDWGRELIVSSDIASSSDEALM